jgi:threonine dehydratase
MNIQELKNSLMPNQLTESYARSKKYFLNTPIIKSDFLSSFFKTNIYFKQENLQETQAFKLRGAINALLTIAAEGKVKKVVCSSSGSHAMGMCLAGKKLGFEVIVFLPGITPEFKIDKIAKLGGKINFFGEYLSEAQNEAMSYAEKNSLPYISPYNHPATIQGNGGFIAHEIINHDIDFKNIICPVGGGGLLTGLTAALALHEYGARVIGVESVDNPSMFNAIKNNDPNFPLDSKPSIAEALICGVSQVGFPLIQEYVSDLALIPESAIKNSMKLLLHEENLLVEGAGAISTAFLFENKKNLRQENYLLLITGGNIKESTVINLT